MTPGIIPGRFRMKNEMLIWYKSQNKSNIMKESLIIGLVWLSLVAVTKLNAQEKVFTPLIINNTGNGESIANDSTHNCRFWGMLAVGSFDDSSKISHLNSLRQLASSNPDGWGFGFYTKTVRGGLIPVMYRGMWRADQDCLFDSSARIMVKNLSTCGIAHIRHASSGYVNIPNPHPFYTKSMQRDFSMFFAHNGTLDITVLKTLLDTYTDTNHYSYGGNGVNDPNNDSDLYRLYLMKWIDEHPSSGITASLNDALDTLTTQMGYSFSYNFIMASTYDTLWALRYNNTLSYRRESGSLGYVWEVASQPLGGADWVSATNHYLYIFSAGKATPDSIQIKNEAWGMPEYVGKSSTVDFNFTNPAVGNTLDIDIESEESQKVTFQLFDANGRSLSELSGIAIDAGENHVSYDIRLLKAGIYYLKMETGKTSQTKKLVIVFSH